MTARIAIVGNLNMDLLMGPLARAPDFGHEAFVAERSLRAAGQVFYPVAALAALGAPPHVVGDVGDDEMGARIIADLRATEADVGGIRVCTGLPTGLSVALLNQQRDRAFVTHPGHLTALDAASVMSRWEWIAGCSILHFCGYCCLPGLIPDGGVAIMRRAQAEGITTVLDTGWDPDDWATGRREEVRAMLQYTDIFMPNREEVRALTGRDDPDAAATQLADWGARMVIVKLGSDGALARRGGERVHVGVLPAIVADTVGAGDCFDAGTLYALARGWPLADALRLGTVVAGYAIAGHDPRYPTLEQALALMSRVGSPDAGGITAGGMV